MLGLTDALMEANVPTREWASYKFPSEDEDAGAVKSTVGSVPLKGLDDDKDISRIETVERV